MLERGPDSVLIHIRSDLKPTIFRLVQDEGALVHGRRDCDEFIPGPRGARTPALGAPPLFYSAATTIWAATMRLVEVRQSGFRVPLEEDTSHSGIILIRECVRAGVAGIRIGAQSIRTKRKIRG